MISPHLMESGGLIPANPSLVPPVRAAFYFPWFDEGWVGNQAMSHYTPVLGQYDQNDPAVIAQHMAWAKAAGIDAFICMWRGIDGGSGISASTFGANQYNTDTKFPHLLDIALQYGIKITAYYEVEGYTNPTAGEIATEFAYFAANYWDHPAWLKVGGKPVMFAYGPGDATGCARYASATSNYTTAYVSLIYTGSPAVTPPAQHSFSAAHAVSVGNSYTILPGWWLGSSGTPVTVRSLATWTADVAAMVASGKDWHLIISWNEWGEGSIIEPTVEFGTDYLDALAAV